MKQVDLFTWIVRIGFGTIAIIVTLAAIDLKEPVLIGTAAITWITFLLVGDFGGKNG